MLEGPSFLISRDVPSSCEQENKWIYNTFRLVELSNNKRRLEVEEEKQAAERKSQKFSNDLEEEEKQMNTIFIFPSQDQNQAANFIDDSSWLIHPNLGRDNSINCLLRCSRSNYGSIALVNRSFRSLIRSGELYKMRRKMGVIEQWVYFSCFPLEWDAFDPTCARWMHLPKMITDDCFMASDKESLGVGTELLVLGREIKSQAIYRYSILTNSWSSATEMNTPRYLFGSASLGEIAIIAGGCDMNTKTVSTAELYDSDTGLWSTLPDMNKARRMCSAVFMDGKFYVLGGIGVDSSKRLTCGEEFDLRTKKWREIPNMFPTLRDDREAIRMAPPLIAVVNNELYAADHVMQELRKYVKSDNSWITLGRLPVRASSMNGWGLAFRACGDQLVVIGGTIGCGRGVLEINAWVPNEGAPQWNLLGRRETESGGCFVYNCAVMGC